MMRLACCLSHGVWTLLILIGDGFKIFKTIRWLKTIKPWCVSSRFIVLNDFDVVCVFAAPVVLIGAFLSFPVCDRYLLPNSKK